MRSPLTLFVWLTWGAVVSLCIVFSVQAVSVAQLPPSQEVTNEHKVRQFRAWMENTNADDFQKRERWHRILTRSARAKLPGLSRLLVTRGGLAGVAVGVWVHNGVTLYDGLQGPEDPSPLHLSTEFRQAELVLDGSGGGGGAMRYYDSSGTLTGSGMVMSATYTYDPAFGKCTATFTYAGTSTVVDSLQYFGIAGFAQTAGQSTGTVGCGSSYTLRERGSDANGRSFTNNEVNPASNGDVRYEFYTADSGGPRSNERRYFGAPVIPGQNTRWENPVYDWGATTVAPAEYQPSQGDYVATPEQSDALYDAIKADPEYQPTTDDLPTESDDHNTQHERRVGELVPEHGPVIDTTTNPDGSVTTTFQDGTTLTTWPNGDETVRTPDGREVTRYADGTREEWDPATRRLTTTYPDGTTRVRQYPEDGTNTRPSPSTTPQTENWTDPAGNNITRPSTSQYPETIQRPAPAAPGAPGGGSPDPSLACPVPLEATPSFPPIHWEDKFPFSLILTARDTLGQLVGTPTAPVFDLPMIGQQDLSRFDSHMSVIRVVWLVLIGGILMPLMFYRLIKGGGD